MNSNPYIYILSYQSNDLNYLASNPASEPYKMKCLICNRGVGTANVDKQRRLFADVEVTPPRGAI